MKVFNVLANEVYDFETMNRIYSFLNKEDAEVKVKQLRDNYLQQVEPDDGYEITDEPELFDCYPEGNAGEEHYTVQIYECEIEDAGAEAPSASDRSLALRQMERELIDVVYANGDDDILLLDDLGMRWTEECDSECHTKDIEAIEVRLSVDGFFIVVNIDGELVPFNECDRDDLGHNLADYIYNEIKTYY